MNAIWHDPVVAELHSVRERLAEEYHGDLAAYSAAAAEHCRELGLSIERDKMRPNSEASVPAGQANPLSSPWDENSWRKRWEC